jgi:hypothetical protein
MPEQVTWPKNARFAPVRSLTFVGLAVAILLFYRTLGLLTKVGR